MKVEKEVKEIQNKLLEIIKFIDKICQENNIEYYLLYGSCIGAIRHKGFIPWDDDLDIGMTYPNYLKFAEIMKKQKSQYFFQTIETDKEYDLLFGKVRDSKTTCVHKRFQDKDINQGLYVDVFPITGVPKSKLGQAIYKINRGLAIRPYDNLFHNKILSAFSTLLLKVMGKEKMRDVFTKKLFKYGMDQKYWLSVFSEEMDNEILPKEAFGKPQYVKFEDTKLPIPEGYDIHLSQIYGDYMQMPSEEQRTHYQHEVIFLDLNTPYKKYMKEKPWCKND